MMKSHRQSAARVMDEVELKGLEKEYTQADPVSDQAYEEWIKQFDSKPLWNHLELRFHLGIRCEARAGAGGSL